MGYRVYALTKQWPDPSAPRAKWYMISANVCPDLRKPSVTLEMHRSCLLSETRSPTMDKYNLIMRSISHQADYAVIRT